LKTLTIEDAIIENYRVFYEGIRSIHPEITGGEYDTDKMLLKLFLTDDSEISENDIRNYIKNPKVRVVLRRKTIHEEVGHQFENALVIQDSTEVIEVLIEPESKADIIAFIKSKKSDFEEEKTNISE